MKYGEGVGHIKDKRGFTVMHYAVSRGDPTILDKLLEVTNHPVQRN